MIQSFIPLKLYMYPVFFNKNTPNVHATNATRFDWVVQMILNDFDIKFSSIGSCSKKVIIFSFEKWNIPKCYLLDEKKFKVWRLLGFNAIKIGLKSTLSRTGYGPMLEMTSNQDYPKSFFEVGWAIPVDDILKMCQMRNLGNLNIDTAGTMPKSEF